MCTFALRLLRLCLQRCLRVLYLASWYSLNCLNLSAIAFFRHIGRERLKHWKHQIVVWRQTWYIQIVQTIQQIIINDLLYCRFWLFPANQTAAVQQHRSICGHVAWWAAGWQPEPIRSSQWSEYLASVECKVPPRLEQTDHIIYDIHDYGPAVYHSLAVLTLMTHHFKLVIWEYLMCVHQGWKIKQTPKWNPPPSKTAVPSMSPSAWLQKQFTLTKNAQLLALKSRFWSLWVISFFITTLRGMIFFVAVVL